MLKIFKPSFDSQPERAPTASVSRTPNAYGFHTFLSIDDHPMTGYVKEMRGIPGDDIDTRGILQYIFVLRPVRHTLEFFTNKSLQIQIKNI